MTRFTASRVSALLTTAALALSAIAAAAVAQDPTPTAFPASDLDLMSVMRGLLGSVNVPALVMLSIIAGAGHRTLDYFGWKKSALVFLWVVPPMVGMVLGMLSAVIKAPPVNGDWVSQARLMQSMLEGMLINGGMAILLGGIASVGAAKLGIFSAPPRPTEVTP